MFKTMALPQPPRDPLQVPVTVLRGRRYALALETMALPQFCRTRFTGSR